MDEKKTKVAETKLKINQKATNSFGRNPKQECIDDLFTAIQEAKQVNIQNQLQKIPKNEKMHDIVIGAIHLAIKDKISIDPIINNSTVNKDSDLLLKVLRIAKKNQLTDTLELLKTHIPLEKHTLVSDRCDYTASLISAIKENKIDEFKAIYHKILDDKKLSKTPILQILFDTFTSAVQSNMNSKAVLEAMDVVIENKAFIQEFAQYIKQNLPPLVKTGRHKKVAELAPYCKKLKIDPDSLEVEKDSSMKYSTRKLPLIHYAIESDNPDMAMALLNANSIAHTLIGIFNCNQVHVFDSYCNTLYLILEKRDVTRYASVINEMLEQIPPKELDEVCDPKDNNLFTVLFPLKNDTRHQVLKKILDKYPGSSLQVLQFIEKNQNKDSQDDELDTFLKENVRAWIQRDLHDKNENLPAILKLVKTLKFSITHGVEMETNLTQAGVVEPSEGFLDRWKRGLWGNGKSEKKEKKYLTESRAEPLMHTQHKNSTLDDQVVKIKINNQT